MNTCKTCRLVLDEEKNEIKFESNFGRDKFIKSVLESVDNKLTNDGISEKNLKIEEEYIAPPSVRADWVSGFLEAYKRILKSCNEEQLEEIFNNVRFDWKMFNNGDVE